MARTAVAPPPAPRNAPVRKQTPTAADLVALARERFVHRRPIDLQGLADELGVSRATAYRWAGNVDLLIGEVVAALVDDTFASLLEETRHLKGAARVLAVQERGMRAILTFRPLREFLESDPQRGLRIIASKEGPVQQRTIAHHQRLLEEEMARGRLELPIDSHTLAYALTRIGEAFLYADLVAGEEPDVDKAMKVLRLMLDPPALARGRASPGG